MGKIQKIKSRILVDWPEGRDAEPRVLTCAPTMEEAVKLEQVVRDAFRKIDSKKTAPSANWGL